MNFRRFSLWFLEMERFDSLVLRSPLRQEDNRSKPSMQGGKTQLSVVPCCARVCPSSSSCEPKSLPQSHPAPENVSNTWRMSLLPTTGEKPTLIMRMRRAVVQFDSLFAFCDAAWCFCGGKISIATSSRKFWRASRRECASAEKLCIYNLHTVCRASTSCGFIRRRS